MHCAQTRRSGLPFLLYSVIFFLNEWPVRIMMTENDGGVGAQAPRCAVDVNHPYEHVKECASCHKFLCPSCMKSHNHYSDELYLTARKLMTKYPRCRDVIDKELAKLRERGRLGELQSIAVQEISIDLISVIERLPCAQKGRKTYHSGKRSYKR